MRFPWARGQNRRRKQRGRNAGRLSVSGQRSLRVEPLEQRSLLAIVAWDGGGTDSLWSNPLNWSEDSLPGAEDEVVIDVEGDHTIVHDSGVTHIKKLTSQESLTLSGGELAVDGDILVEGTFTIEGGKISGGTVEGNLLTVTSDDGTLDGVTLEADLDVLNGGVVTVLNGLTLNGTATLLGANVLTGLEFFEDQSLQGTGTIVFGGTNPDASESVVRPVDGTLTIQDGITISGTFGTLGNQSASLINEGSIHSDLDNSFLELFGSFLNSGTLRIGATSRVSAEDFTQTLGGSLEIQVDPDLVGGQIPLTISGISTLTGRLQVEFVNTFPTLGEIDLLEGIHAGEFSNVSVLGLSSSTSGNILYEDPTHVQIEVVEQDVQQLLVSNTNSTGDGSLHAALTQANTLDGEVEVLFNMPENDPNFNGSVFRIDTDVLPTLDNPDVFVTLVGASQEAFGGDTNPFGPEVFIFSQDPLTVAGSSLVMDSILGLNVAALSGGRINVVNLAQISGGNATAEDGGEISFSADTTEVEGVFFSASEFGRINFNADMVTFRDTLMLALESGRINANSMELADALSGIVATDRGTFNIAQTLEVVGGFVSAGEDGQVLIGDIQSAPADFALQATDGGISLFGVSRNSEFDFASNGPLPIDDHGRFDISDTFYTGLAGTYEVAIGGSTLVEENWEGQVANNDSLELASIEILEDRLQLTAPFLAFTLVGTSDASLTPTGQFVAFAELPPGATVNDVRDLVGSYEFRIDPEQTFLEMSGDFNGVPFSPQAPGSDVMRFTGFFRASFGDGSIAFPGGSRITTIQNEGVFLPGVESQPANIHIAPGGLLSGGFRLNGDVFNDGTIEVGGGGISGNFTQSDLGVISKTISDGVSLPAVIEITGAASLDGDLVITPVSGFEPTPGEQFPVMSFASRSGDFLNIGGLRLDNGIFLKPVFDETSLTLEAIEPAIIITEPPGGLVTSEDGAQATFALQLAVDPEVPVTIDLLSLASDEGSYSPASVTFFPDDTEPIKSITVTGLDDADFDGDQVYSILLSVTNESDPAYVGLQSDPVVVTNLDDELPLVVTTALDIVDPEDNLLSLREAIIIANEDDSFNAVHFAIDTGLQTIALEQALPEIIHPVIVDATTQPGFTGVPIIELNGLEAGGESNGLVLRDHEGSVISGFVVNQFGTGGSGSDTGYGILISGGGSHHISGNYIGTNAGGTAALANRGTGIMIQAASSQNLIGTNADGVDDVSERNVISGNGIEGSGTPAAGIEIVGGSSQNIIAGNFIGTDVSGTIGLGNHNSNVVINESSDNVVGGSTVTARNIIAASNFSGVHILDEDATGNATGNWVAGNYIGTDVTGSVALGNGTHGIHIDLGAASNRIGTDGDGIADNIERNVISANQSNGIRLADVANISIQGNYIGTDAEGEQPLGNQGPGIRVVRSIGDIQIGGSSAAERNVISGNAGVGVRVIAGTDVRIQGNHIGVTAVGDQPLGNEGSGIRVDDSSGGILIGGSAPELGNVISANGVDGIRLFRTTDIKVQANYVGTDHTATIAGASFGNVEEGVHITEGSAFVIVGTDGDTLGDDKEGNVISGNGKFGVSISNGFDSIVAGNFIGTDNTGTVALPNNIGEIAGDLGAGVGLKGGAQRNLIGTNGDGASDELERNVISGNQGRGIRIAGEATGHNVIAGNYIGVDFDALNPLPNTTAGIGILEGAHENVVGIDSEGDPHGVEGNVIAGNGIRGIVIQDADSSNNVIAGNFIGTNRNLAANIGNGSAEPGAGIRIRAGATDNTVGGAGDLANVIAFNSGAGVVLLGDLTQGNRFAENSFFGNGDLAIDLLNDGVTANDAGDTDAGPNGLQNFPVIHDFVAGSSTQITGRFNSTPSTEFTLDFYANVTADPSGYGEGERYLGSAIVTTNEGGNFEFDVTIDVATTSGEFLTATATDPEGNTSEFGGMNDRPFVANPITDVIDEESTAGRTIDLSSVFNDPDIPFDLDVLTITVISNTNSELVSTLIEETTLTLVYSEGRSGQAEITLRATDLAGDFDDHTFQVTVIEENVAPVLAPIGDQAVDEGVELGFAAQATDIDLPEQTLVFSLDPGAPDGATIDPSSGVFTWTPTEEQGPGVYPVTIRVNDSAGGEDFKTIEITVNEVNVAPMLAPIGDQAIDEGIELKFAVLATDFDLPANTLIITLDPGAPEGATIDPSSGVFTWTPTEGQGPGVYPVTIRVSDSAGGEDFETIEITVNEVNVDPILAPVSDQAVDEENELRLTLTASDLDLPANTLTFTLDPSAPAGSRIDPESGVFTWTPTEEQGPGTYEVTIRVSDQSGGEDSETIQIVVGEFGRAPEIDPITSKLAIVGEPLTFDVTAFDRDIPAPQALTYRIISEAPEGATLGSNSGTFFWIPNESHAGQTFMFTIEVSDNGDPPLRSTQSFFISVEEQASNEAPVVSFPFEDAPELMVNELFSFGVMATDPDGPNQDLIFSLAPGAPTGATIDPITGEFRWTPGEEHAGQTFEIAVRASDQGDPAMTTEKSFQAIVDGLPVNQAPILQPIGPRTADEGETLQFTAAATDPDHSSPTLTFRLGPGAPSGAAIDPVTGQFTWVPTEEQGGENFVIVVQVLDPDGAIDSESITVAVAEVNTPPQISPIEPLRVHENSRVEFEIEVTDPDMPTQSLTFDFKGELPGEWTFDHQSRLFSWDPERGGPLGDFQLVLTVLDDMGAQTSKTLDFSVEDAVDGQLQSVVFDDQNGNEIRDLGEPGIEGVQASLLLDTDLDGIFETVFGSETSNEFGELNFSNLPRGMYQMSLDTPSLPSGFTLLSSTNSSAVEIRSGREFVDSGFRLGSVNVVVLTPADPSFEVPNEIPAEGPSGSVISQDPNSQGGDILTVSYNPQSEELRVVGPSGTSSRLGAGQSTSEVQLVQAMRFGGGDATGEVSDVMQTSGTPAPLPSVAADEVLGDVLSLSDDISASLFILPSSVEADTPPASELLGSIVGVLFEDLDKNGKFDVSHEKGIPNQRVFLDLNRNGEFDDGEPTVLSDYQGRFRFSELEPGSYNVVSKPGEPWQYAREAQREIAVVLEPGQPELRDINFALFAQEEIETAEPTPIPWLWWLSGTIGFLTIGWGAWIVRRYLRQKDEADYWQSKPSISSDTEQTEGHEDTESDLSKTDAGTVRDIPSREFKT